MASIELIKQLREETEVSLAECKKALEAAGGDIAKARTILQEWGKKVAAKKQERETHEGIIEAYTHANGKIGVLVELRCETDFVARSQDFKTLAHEIALQIVGADPQSVEELLSQEHIRDSKKTILNLMEQTIGKLGEKIVVQRFSRFQL